MLSNSQTINQKQAIANGLYNRVNDWLLLPLIGSLLFCFLYILAALYYPGGSPFDKTTKGFTWTENYWCNLLNEQALNGAPNSARPLAFAAMFVLCISLAAFWFLFTVQVNFKKSTRLLTQVSGAGAMAIAPFIFTSFHDAIINTAGCLGLVALGGTFAGLRKLGWTAFFRMGLFILLLVALNNLLYYCQSLQVYLPVVQKFTFAYFLLWISLISLRLYKRANASVNGMQKPEHFPA